MLILVRHAQPAIDPNKPSAEWQLSEDGRTRSRELAEQLRSYQPDIVITSHEPKAAETGRIIAETLGLPCETAENLHEHQRTGQFFSQEQFQQKIRDFFERPAELVFGLETAEEALERFEAAVTQTITRHPHQNIIIATHGTVITLFVSAHNDIEPIPFWQQLKMPDYKVLTQTSFKLLY
jgi:2,3-bisphosphoglycerate-dependent phosphoglycerate mutase